MAIFYDEYLNEHGGAHRRYVNDEYKKYKEAEDMANKYFDASRISTNDKARKKLVNKCKEYEKKANRYNVGGNIDKVVRAINKNNSATQEDTDNSSYYSRYIKRKIGAGKDNMPKDREPGEYLKMQNRLRGMKEACEYILSVIDESYDYDEYDDEY